MMRTVRGVLSLLHVAVLLALFVSQVVLGNVSSSAGLLGDHVHVAGQHALTPQLHQGSALAQYDSASGSLLAAGGGREGVQQGEASVRRHGEGGQANRNDERRHAGVQGSEQGTPGSIPYHARQSGGAWPGSAPTPDTGFDARPRAKPPRSRRPS